MTILTQNDYKFFEHLVSLTQQELHNFMNTLLHQYYSKIEATKDYTIATGDIPIALVAHMDTVFAQPPKEIYYDRNKNVIWSPDGLGADDRAGIFLIIKILLAGFKPHIILTTDEELGGLGASVLASIHTKCPFPNLKYLIQLDRRGINDCVFYSCITQKFIDYISKFGFVEAYGSFSDISELCPAWDKCGVNLSVGYIDEHSTNERLFVNGLLSTLKKLKTILSQTVIPNFKYESYEDDYWDYRGYYHYGDFGYGGNKSLKTYVYCDKCKKAIQRDTCIEVQKSATEIAKYCIDCFKDTDVRWCDTCGEGFEVTKGNIQQKNCYLCNPHITKQEKEKRYIEQTKH